MLIGIDVEHGTVRGQLLEAVFVLTRPCWLTVYLYVWSRASGKSERVTLLNSKAIFELEVSALLTPRN